LISLLLTGNRDKSIRDLAEVLVSMFPPVGEMGFDFPCLSDLVSIFWPFLHRSPVDHWLFQPFSMHKLLRLFVHRLQGPNTLSPKAVCILTLAKNIHVLQVLDSISGPETSIPGWQRTGPKTHSVTQNDRPDGLQGRQNHSIPVHLGCKCFSLWSSFIEPPSVENSVNAPKLLRRTGAPSAGHGILLKTPKAKKTARIFGDLVIEITSKSQDMVIIW
jgi:hypothetical protein